jgi:hypothetical protein
MAGGVIMLIPFALAWLRGWLPHQREVPKWSHETNQAYRGLMWSLWLVWLALALAGILSGLYTLIFR